MNDWNRFPQVKLFKGCYYLVLPLWLEPLKWLETGLESYWEMSYGLRQVSSVE